VGRGFRMTGKGLLILIFVPLLIGLFFMMPADFCWSSWHLLAAQETTTGVVVSAKESTGEGRGHGTRSDIVYRYRVNGTEYAGSRVRPGFMDAAYEADGSELARGLKPGDAIPVYYSGKDPSFAFLLKGWPKWSVGFSLVVWGAFAVSLWCPDRKKGERPSPFWRYVFLQAVPFTGLITVAILDPVILVTDFWIPFLIYAGVVLLGAGFWPVRFRRTQSGPPTRWLRPRI